MPGVDMVSGGMFGCLLVPLSDIGSSDSDVKTDWNCSFSMFAFSIVSAIKSPPLLRAAMPELSHILTKHISNSTYLSNRFTKMYLTARFMRFEWFYFFRTEKEYKSVKKQLTSEVDNKKSVIGSLSKELEIHQKNFNELKDELNKVKIK